YLPPFGQDPNGQANRRLVAQAPGQKRAIIPSSSQPRRDDTKPLTTDAPLPVWGTRQGIGLPHRGDLGLAPPGWFGHGLLTRPCSATAVSDRRRGRTAGSGDPRRTVGRSNGGVWRPSPTEVFSRPGPILETVLDPDPDLDPDLAHHPALARRCIVMSLVQRVRGESKKRSTIRMRIRKRPGPIFET